MRYEGLVAAATVFPFVAEMADEIPLGDGSRIGVPSRRAEVTIERVEVHVGVIDDHEPAVSIHPPREADRTVRHCVHLGACRPPEVFGSMEHALGSSAMLTEVGVVGAIFDDVERIVEGQRCVRRVDIREVDPAERRTRLRRSGGAPPQRHGEEDKRR